LGEARIQAFYLGNDGPVTRGASEFCEREERKRSVSHRTLTIECIGLPGPRAAIRMALISEGITGGMVRRKDGQKRASIKAGIVKKSIFGKKKKERKKRCSTERLGQANK